MELHSLMCARIEEERRYTLRMAQRRVIDFISYSQSVCPDSLHVLALAYHFLK